MSTILRPSSLLLALVAALFIAGCGGKKTAQDSGSGGKQLDYAVEREKIEKSDLIAPGFTVDVRHSADEEINGRYVVDFNGSLKLPYKVDVKAAGLTVAELKDRITKAFASFFKANNNVSVDIVKREYLVEARGLVSKPGKYPVSVDTSVEELAQLAGGFPGGSGTDGKPAQKPEYLRIVRRDFKTGKTNIAWLKLADYFAKYDTDVDLLWRGGEQVFFQATIDPEAETRLKKRGGTVQVTGEVRNPGDYPVQANATVYMYITAAGGPASSADLTSVAVVSKATGKSREYDATSDDRIEDIQPGDSIIVRSVSAKSTGFERALPLILGVTSVITSVLLVVFVL